MPNIISKPLLRAYVDETGDRGMSAKASQFFSFAAVVIADEDEPSLRAAIAQLRNDFRVPIGKALHWKDHVKEYGRRDHAATVLSNVPNLKIIYVVVEKAAIPQVSGLGRSQVLFYNYAAALVLERVLLAAGNFPGGPREVIMRFGHVKGFNHTSTANYFNLRVQMKDPHWVPWHLLRTPVNFDGQTAWDGLQAADQYAGILSAAICPNQFGGYEHHHLLKVIPQIDCVGGKRIGYGFKIFSTMNTLQLLPWWAQAAI